MERRRGGLSQRPDRAPAPSGDGAGFVACIGAHDRDGAYALLASCSARLRGYLRMRYQDQLGGRQGVEEVVSAALWQAIERGSTYRPERGELGFWLWRIGVHLAQDEIRRTAVRRRHESGAAGEAAAGRSPTDLRRVVEEAIDRLRDERHRWILRADLDHGGLAPAAVLSQQLGLAEQTILNLRNVARKQVRPLLEGLVDDGA